MDQQDQGVTIPVREDQRESELVCVCVMRSPVPARLGERVCVCVPVTDRLSSSQHITNPRKAAGQQDLVVNNPLSQDEGVGVASVSLDTTFFPEPWECKHLNNSITGLSGVSLL
jgi:hypothetical protein